MTEYMSYKAATEYLGLKTQNTLRKYIAAGLPVIDVNGSKRISKTAIDEFMKEHQTTATVAESESAKKGA